jgi:hypothetical protein
LASHDPVAASVPLKVTKRTKELVRLGSSIERCTQGEFVKRAVDWFIEQPDTQAQLAEGLAHAHKVLDAS